MATPTNVVNLDALIRRADLAAIGEQGDDIEVMSINGLEPGGMLYPALRKPDFQRETANWTPDGVADLIVTFAKRELIPAVILWRSGQDVFVIDGAHRLSALIAWVHDDYGDGDISRKFFQNAVPDEQKRNAQRTRELVKVEVGSYDDHRKAITSPEIARADIRERASRLGWERIPVQWIRNADHEKAEKAFFRINQGGQTIDPVERRILQARGSATALASRAILRGGTGNEYWKAFDAETRAAIEDLGREVQTLLFEPTLTLPIKTLDIPVAGQGYGPRILPTVFDLVNLANRVSVKDSSHKRATSEGLPSDPDGETTISYLANVRKVLRRICSTHPSSLGLHPALYFYSRNGTFQSSALLNYVVRFGEWETPDFLKFTQVRAKFEEFILANRGITEAVRRLGSGARSRPRVLSFYRLLITRLSEGVSPKHLAAELAKNPVYEFLVAADNVADLLDEGGTFDRDVKGAAYIKQALPTAPKCLTCGGLLHRNGMQVGHKKARREGGSGTLANAGMQHPFCNSTVAN